MLQDVCPSARKNGHLYLKVLHEACLKVGGEHHLARRLGVTVTCIEMWLNKGGMPPAWVFLACLDIVDGRQRGAIQ